jgi:tRNA (adenine37-N6)-methyltransferase
MKEQVKIFKALASESRLKILLLLKEQPQCVGALARRLDMTQPSISQHLRVLTEAGLVRSTKTGNRVHYEKDGAAIECHGEAIAQIFGGGATPKEAHRDKTSSCRPIGVIHSRYRTAKGTPIQPVYAEQSKGTVVLDEAFAPALADLEGFERIWICYWFDRAGPYTPRVVPYRDTVEHGLFATRSPCRPNPMGLSVVRLLSRQGATLHVADLDVLDGTPLLDIKPYVPQFDAHPGSRGGWLDADREDRRVADGRFHEDAGETD